MFKKEEKTGRYYCIATRISSVEHAHHRNLLSLMSSEDMLHWKVVCDLFDRRDRDPQYTGFQYADFEIEGDELSTSAAPQSIGLILITIPTISPSIGSKIFVNGRALFFSAWAVF